MQCHNIMSLQIIYQEKETCMLCLNEWVSELKFYILYQFYTTSPIYNGSFSSEELPNDKWRTEHRMLVLECEIWNCIRIKIYRKKSRANCKAWLEIETISYDLSIWSGQCRKLTNLIFLKPAPIEAFLLITVSFMWSNTSCDVIAILLCHWFMFFHKNTQNNCRTIDILEYFFLTY